VKSRDVLAVFNRGRISRLALARTDVSRVALSADIQTNWMPRTLGPMMLRPGFGYTGTVLGDGADIPFIYSNTDSAILELSAGAMRIAVNGEQLLTRPAVTAAVTNGAFTSNVTGWTDADDAGTVSDWFAGNLRLTGDGLGTARRRQTVSVSQPGVLHALRIVVTRGPVILRVGTTDGGDELFRQAVLRRGTHSIAFTPASEFRIEFSSSLKYPVLVDSCTVEAAGVVSLPTPWVTAQDCKMVRWHQSGDVVFCACKGYQQQRIERRSNGSWSVAVYAPEDGPFLDENTEAIRISASALSGETTLTASKPLFKSGHVGALFKISSQGQKVSADLSADGAYTNAIRVFGVGTGRVFAISRVGTWSGTLLLQRSIGEPGDWQNVNNFTANGADSFNDGLDNTIAYYRLGFDTGYHTSGTVEASLNYAVGSITGVVSITAVASNVSADAVVLSDLGGTAATDVWAEGAWSDVQGWPEAVALAEGRLWWSGNGRNYGSASDAITVFGDGVIGDSAPINRRIGEGAINAVNWILPMQNLIVGTDGGEHSVRSTSFEEPVTPSNYNVKTRSSKGSKPVPAVMADGLGYFVGRTGSQAFELSYDPGSYGYVASDTTTLVPEIGKSGFVRLAIQQSPDARLHCVRTDGTVAVMVRDTAEDVKSWVDVVTDGAVEDVVVLPGDIEDRVFYRVRRIIGGTVVRYREKWAREDEARGGTNNKIADSFVSGTGPITGLSHLNGKSVVIWGDGVDRGTATVSGGAVPGDYTVWCVGLPYTAPYKSAKLAGQTGLGLSLTQESRVDHIGLVLADTHAQGLRFGPDFDELDSLPRVEGGALVDANHVWQSYDEGMVEFPGEWSSDNRICLVASAPRPCTVLGAVLSVDREDKA